jgi:CBS domain-containing protein
MRIDTLHAATSSRLAVVNIDATVRTAALLLSTPSIGLVVVCHAKGKAAGVLCSSDLVRHLANSGSAEEPVATLMSRRVVYCSPNDDVHAVWMKMAAQSLQNVPVLGADCKLLGVLDIRDAMSVLLEQEERQEQMLVNYITGIGYH